MDKKLRLYVWEGFCPDYTGGLAFAVAENEGKARKLVEKRLGGQVWEWGTLHVMPLTKRVARCVCGGG